MSPTLMATLAALAGALAGGWAAHHVARKASRRIEGEVARLEAELSRTEAQAREESRRAKRLHEQLQATANCIRTLPHMARELNREDLRLDEIPHLLFALVDAMFEPERILLYKLDRGELHLQQQRGFDPVSPELRRIRIGEGRIGWVAETKRDMTADDWLNPALFTGPILPAKGEKLELIGPLLHGDQLLGVLAIGGVCVHPRDEKLMLQMATNLASIAVTNTTRVQGLQDHANRDGLTGLLNKRHFMRERLVELIYQAGRQGHPLGIFIFDIDHFKVYNDQNGHLAGDDILKGVAEVLRANLRAADVACRYGGEEFVVAMPHADPVLALQVAERIRRAIETHPFPHREKQPLGRLTISGGVAAYPVDGSDGTKLVGRADEALYQAKAGGRNRVLAYKGVSIGDSAADPFEHESAGRPDAALER